MTNTGSEARQHFDRASSLEEARDYQAALDECDAAINLDPAFADAHNLRGIILDGLGRPEEAVESYRAAATLDPAFEEARENLRDAVQDLQGVPLPAHGPEGKKFGIRAVSQIIDLIVQYLASIVAGVALGVVLALVIRGAGLRFVGTDQTLFNCLQIVWGVALSILYFTIFEWLYGASPGKLVLSMRVVKENGDPCDLGSALMRGALRYADGIIFGAIAYVNMKAPLYQRLGDKAARTIVVSSSDPIIRQPREWWWFLVAAGVWLTVDVIGTMLFLLPYLR